LALFEVSFLAFLFLIYDYAPWGGWLTGELAFGGGFIPLWLFIFSPFAGLYGVRICEN